MGACARGILPAVPDGVGHGPKAWLAGGGGGRAVELALQLAAALARGLHRLKGPGTGIALVYHRVDAHAGDPARELVPALPAQAFEAQVRHLVRHYDVVTARDLPAAARARRRGARLPVALTFDDDYPSHLEHVAPALRRAGAPA